MPSKMLHITWFKYLQAFLFYRHRGNVNESRIEKVGDRDNTISLRNLF